jgi:hypothetical protein
MFFHQISVRKATSHYLDSVHSLWNSSQCRELKALSKGRLWTDFLSKIFLFPSSPPRLAPLTYPASPELIFPGWLIYDPYLVSLFAPFRDPNHDLGKTALITEFARRNRTSIGVFEFSGLFRITPGIRRIFSPRSSVNKIFFKIHKQSEPPFTMTDFLDEKFPSRGRKSRNRNILARNGSLVKGALHITRSFFSEGQISTPIIADYNGSIARTFLNKLPRATLQILRLRCDIYLCMAHSLSRYWKMKRMAGWCDALSVVVRTIWMALKIYPRTFEWDGDNPSKTGQVK